jgi:hypothetical protein
VGYAPSALTHPPRYLMVAEKMVAEEAEVVILTEGAKVAFATRSDIFRS